MYRGSPTSPALTKVLLVPRGILWPDLISLSNLSHVSLACSLEISASDHFIALQRHGKFSGEWERMCLSLCTLSLPSLTSHRRQGRLGKGAFSPSLRTDCTSSSLCFNPKRSQNIFAGSWRWASFPPTEPGLGSLSQCCDRGDIARVPALAGSGGKATQQQKAAWFYCIGPL